MDDNIRGFHIVIVITFSFMFHVESGHCVYKHGGNARTPFDMISSQTVADVWMLHCVRVQPLLSYATNRHLFTMLTIHPE